MFSKFAFTFGLTVLPLVAHPSPAHNLKQVEAHLLETPDDPDLLRLKANLLIERHPKMAAKLLRKLVRIDPGKPEDRMLQARVDAALGRTDEALTELGDLLKSDPGLYQGWALLSDLHESTGRRDEAISSAMEHLERSPSPSPTDVLTCAGWLHERGKPGDAETAVRLLDRGLSRIGCLTGLHEMAIGIELETGHYDSALHRIDVLEARYRPTVAFALRRADILEKAGRPDQAADACDSAIALLDLAPASRKKTEAFQQELEAVVIRKAANDAKAGGA